MKAHNLEVVGGAILSYTPTDPDHAVRLRDIQALAGEGSPVFVTDVTPTSSGIVAAKKHEAGIVPSDAVLESCITDTTRVRVHFIAEGGPLKYSPEIRINGELADSITEIDGDKRLFAGYSDLVLTESTDVVINSDTGASDSVRIVLATEGPTVSSVTIKDLPGTQTELKQNDEVPFTGIVGNDAVEINVLDFGAASGQVGNIVVGGEDSASAGFRTFNGTFRTSARTGLQKLRVVAKNFLGTSGTTKDSVNSVTLNQTFPTIPVITVTYPAGQNALKGSESATVNSNITNADTVEYVFDNGTVDNPNVLAANKTVTRTSGTYVTSNNYHITATKESNAATSIRHGNVTIANTAPTATISISGSPTRLRSSVTGENYTVTIDPDQFLNAAPSLDASIGQWLGSWVKATGDRWTRVLQIRDDMEKGSATFSNLVLMNLANVEGSTITSGGNYNVGGITLRQITFPAFARYAPIGTRVENINKTTARYSGASDTITLRNDTNDVAQAYTIVNSAGVYDPKGDHLFINDAAFAGSNTSGTLKLDFEEVI